jgi:3-oxoacyl-[acyl-carrier protein] reductase
MTKDKKVAIVTGSGQGIGRTIATLLAEEGICVVVADLSGTRAKAVADVINAAGGSATPFKCDVADAAQVNAMVTNAVDVFGGVDMLVNNAAYARYGSFLDYDPDVFMRVIQVCLGGYFYCAQAAGREMVKRGGGAIVNISSAAAHVGNVESSSYAAAKGGVLSLTRTLAVELAPHKIRVNAISPGVITTDGMLENMGEKRIKDRMALIPMNRFGMPEEIAKSVRFLLTEESSYITGHILNVDGGWVVGGVMAERQ